MRAFREFLLTVWKQYKSATREQKIEILNELERNLGQYRKYCNRLMLAPYPPKSLHGFRGGKRKQYSESVKYQLERLWRESGYIVPRRLKATLQEWIEYYGHKEFSEGIKEELLRMSVSSVQRFLKNARADLKHMEFLTNSGLLAKQPSHFLS